MAQRIDHLAAIISTACNTIAGDLDQNNLPHPSFDAEGPLTLNLSPQAEHARSTAVDTLQELLDLLQGPVVCMLPKYNATSLQVISRRDIALKVPIQGSISLSDLAEATDLDVTNLKRIMRYAMSFHRLFIEPEEGFIAHSAGSKKLATDDFARAGLAQSMDDFYRAFARTADALDSFKDSEPNHTGYALAHATDKSMFDFLGSKPSKASQFSKAMCFFSAGIPEYSETSLVESYDWGSLGTGTVVDVGGADGYVSRALSKAYPLLEFIVEDLPEVVANAKLLPGAANCARVRYQDYDFFSPQPIHAADIYLFRWVFHDWPDHYVVKILRAQIPALRPGARILVNESLSPPYRALPLTLQRSVCHIDSIMMATSNSRLRSVAEWQSIFRDADPRFQTVRRLSVAEGDALAILEVMWMGE
ncbi:putative O-methyltransferase [Hypoxylon argillaceum]|nr:putative O-methyltransferase [Hypoxylon argillaceum]